MNTEKDFEPFEVDLSYNFKEEEYDNFEPIEVDMSYPPKNLHIDMDLSNLNRETGTLNEWGEKFSVGIMYVTGRLRENGGKATTQVKSKIDQFLFGAMN